MIDEQNNNRGVEKLFILEKPQPFVPVMGELKVKFLSKSARNEDPIDEDMFRQYLAYAYQKAIRTYLHVDEDWRMVCVVLSSNGYRVEKDQTTGNDYLIIEFRIQFPYCKTTASTMSTKIRPYVVRLMGEMAAHKVFNCDYEPKTWGEIIAPDSFTKPLPLLGSVIRDDHYPLGTPVFFQELGEEPGSEDAEEISRPDLDQVFKLSYHNDIRVGNLVEADCLNEYPLKFWFPMFLSLEFCDAITYEIPQDKPARRSKIQKPPPKHHQHDPTDLTISPMSRNTSHVSSNGNGTMTMIENKIQDQDDDDNDVDPVQMARDDPAHIPSPSVSPSLEQKTKVVSPLFQGQTPTLLNQPDESQLNGGWHSRPTMESGNLLPNERENIENDVVASRVLARGCVVTT